MATTDVTVPTTPPHGDPRQFISFGPWHDDEAVSAWREHDGFRTRVGALTELVESFSPHSMDIAAQAGPATPRSLDADPGVAGGSPRRGHHSASLGVGLLPPSSRPAGPLTAGHLRCERIQRLGERRCVREEIRQPARGVRESSGVQCVQSPRALGTDLDEVGVAQDPEVL